MDSSNGAKSNMNSNIYVDNVEESANIPYQILLLRGHVKQIKPNTHGENIFISWNNHPEEAHAINNNTFRAIFQLDAGDNTFTIRFNGRSKNIRVRFERPTAHLPYSVQPMYIICKNHDGRFQAPANVDNSIESAAARILTGAKLIQSVLGELFHVSSFGRKTFYLVEAVEIFRSELQWTQALEMSETELWRFFGREIMCSKIGQQSKKYLAFLSHTKYRREKYNDNISSYHDLLKIIDGYVALGGGGLALFGSASLYTWPDRFNQISKCFADDTPVNRQLFLDHSLGINTMSSNFSTTLGAVIHELLHSFELAHNPVGIMGTDYYKIKQLFRNDCDQNSAILNSPLTSLGVVKKDVGSKYITQIAVDNISLTESSIVILAYNKWWNCSTNADRIFNLSFDASNNFVKSSHGIRVVELRTIRDSCVLKSWIFLGKVLKFSHMVNFDEVRNETVTTLFVMDNIGNFLKQDISVK